MRNGWFSYRWTQIFDDGRHPGVVHRAARRASRAAARTAPCAPAPIAEVVATIREKKPAVVFAPHVETASGMILPDDYLRAVADAVHEVGGLFVLDCIASGAMWVDMQATRRRRADLRAAEGLEQLALLRHGDAERARPRRRSTAPPAPASPAT